MKGSSDSLPAQGQVDVDIAAADALLKAELRCHRCQQEQRNMPTLKAHLATCTVPLSS